METLHYVVFSNGLLVVATGLFYSLLRHETFFRTNRLILRLILAASFGLPFLKLPDWRPDSLRTVMQQTTHAFAPEVVSNPSVTPPKVSTTYPDGHTYRAFSNQQPVFRWSWPMRLLALYIAVVVCLLCRFATQLIAVRRLIRQSVQEVYDDFILVQNQQAPAPFSFLNWVMINPAAHEPDELEQILRHERVHVREHHSLDTMGAELVCILLWFNPAAYLFRYLIQQTLEFTADYTVLREGVDARSYQYNLVKVGLSAGPLRPVVSFSGSLLRHRIRMINRPRSRSFIWWRYVVTLAIWLGIGFGCQFDGAQTHKYIRHQDGDLFGLITASSTMADLDTLRHMFGQDGINLTYSAVDSLSDGRIHRIVLSAQVPRPGHPISTTIGSPYSNAPIPAIGLQANERGLSVSSITDQFPLQLRRLAAQEDSALLSEPNGVALVHDANSVLGFYRVFYRNDFMESNYFGLRTTLLRMTPDYHLDLYPEFAEAVVLLDGREISRAQLRRFHVLDLKKIVTYQGNAAKLRYGHPRAEKGLVLLSSRQNQYARNYYVITPLLKEAYPQLFANY